VFLNHLKQLTQFNPKYSLALWKFVKVFFCNHFLAIRYRTL
jgi:hypothetical protein